MLKKYVFILTIFYSLALALVCLVKLNKLPDMGVSFADKIFHASSYVVLMGLWYYSLVFQFKMNKSKAIIYASIISIIFGIIIEVLQGTLTTTRQADVIDILANTVGVLFMSCLLMLKNRISVKKL